LYRDQHSFEKASEQLTKAHDLTQELISIEDSPGQQDRLGVILTTHGEILNRRDQLQISDQTTPGDGHTALDKQQRTVTIFRQLEQTTSGPLREQTLRKLMEALISMADTLENLELYKESQVAMQEAQVIGKRAQSENNTSSLHLHQQICASTKDTMDARRELDDHTSTLHVGSKIRLHGLLSQTLNGKKGIVLGTASNNRIGIQLQGEKRQVSIRIFNIRYWEDLIAVLLPAVGIEPTSRYQRTFLDHNVGVIEFIREFKARNPRYVDQKRGHPDSGASPQVCRPDADKNVLKG